MLYGAMGYAAFRAWSTAMNSFDAKKVLLAKVLLALSQVPTVGKHCTHTHSVTARRNSLHHPTRS
jgi:hypothetical protein